MSQRQHPPLPTAIRPLYWALRTFGVIAGVSGLLAGIAAAAEGSWATAVIAVVAGVGFMVLTWIHPLSRWFLPTLAGLGLLAVVGQASAGQGSWATVVLVAVPVGLIMWVRRRPRGAGFARTNPDKISIVDPDAVMRNARAFVNDFTMAGFDQVGALRFSIGPVKVIVSLLLSPDGRSYAAVTDSIVNLTSLFPGGRALVTRNSEHTTLPGYLLANNAPGSTAGQLIDSHSQALALVAERDHFPVPVAAPELPEIALQGERDAIEWADTHRHSTNGADSNGPLWVRPGRYGQIDAWLGGGGDEPRL